MDSAIAPDRHSALAERADSSSVLLALESLSELLCKWHAGPGPGGLRGSNL